MADQAFVTANVLASPAGPPVLVPVPIGIAEEWVVARNQTLEQLFRQRRVNLADLAGIRRLEIARNHLDALKPGDTIAIRHIDGVLQQLTRRIDDTTLLSIERGASGFAGELLVTPVEIRIATAQGTINSSLFESGRTVGLSAETILNLANGIFGWDIDFALDIQPGDRFAVVYQQIFRDGQYLGDRQILAAEFVNSGRRFRAVRYESDDGVIADYFAPDGKSMRKQFLRAPVDFKYVSSNFNPRRLHPVLNTTRAHQGVDYAAPTGTPVKASGDGRVSFVGGKGGYGQAVILEHGGGVSTLYGHLSRYAPGLRNGNRVKQGEVIAYVGRTGLATAPHLHYEYRVNGAHKNPRTVILPDAKPIPAAYLPAFELSSAPFVAQLDQFQASPLANATQ